jgi:hypothetical protein
LAGLSDTLGTRPVFSPVEPPNDDPCVHKDQPHRRHRHPRDVRILPPSRDFH